jgi:ankyrin repeat protein
LKPLIVFSFFIFLTGCQLSPKKNNTTTEKNEAPFCFKLIVENKFKEFKENIDNCKNFRSPIGVSTLLMAIARDNNDIAEYLMDQSVDVNETDQAGMTPLIFAANKNNKRLVQLLRRHGARIEVKGDNLSGLMMAVRNSSFELIQLMKPDKNEINVKADDGWTALYFAIGRNDLEILNYLLQHGACANIKDVTGQTPLDFAKVQKWSEGIRRLRRKTSC